MPRTDQTAGPKGNAAQETKSAVDLLIQQAEALGEPPEDPLVLFSALNGFWLVNYAAANGDVTRGLAGQFLALAEKQEATVPLLIGHCLVGRSFRYTEASALWARAIKGRINDPKIVPLIPIAHKGIGEVAEERNDFIHALCTIGYRNRIV